MKFNQYIWLVIFKRNDSESRDGYRRPEDKLISINHCYTDKIGEYFSEILKTKNSKVLQLLLGITAEPQLSKPKLGQCSIFSGIVSEISCADETPASITVE